jgi:sarcosine oxidase
VKAAQHDHGPEVGADAWGPPATDDELEVVGTTLAELLPGAAGPIVDRDICLYTNTLRADLRPDDGNEFIIDRYPMIPASSSLRLAPVMARSSPARSGRCLRTWRST